MSKEKRVIKTTILQIANYWRDNPPYDEIDLNFDWSDCHHVCWNCGDDKKNSWSKTPRLERCHIIPHALGGEDEPSNYVLLCRSCHEESPDHINKKYMWEWILSNKNKCGFYNTYRINKAEELFIKRKGYSFFMDVLPKLDGKCLDDILIEEFKKINTHFNKFSPETYYSLFSEIDDKVNINP